MMLWRVVPLSAAILAGCAVSPPASRVPPGTEAFRTGYAQGCESGFAAANRPRMETRFSQDAKAYADDVQYRDGWQRGFVACHEEERRFPHGDAGEPMS
jgi:hypothetical protein